jgi:hypothetical protein
MIMISFERTPGLNVDEIFLSVLVMKIPSQSDVKVQAFKGHRHPNVNLSVS